MVQFDQAVEITKIHVYCILWKKLNGGSQNQFIEFEMIYLVQMFLRLPNTPPDPFLLNLVCFIHVFSWSLLSNWV